jgi:hypothetical protein
MGLFDELDIASAADNPWVVPDNTYACVVSDLVVKENSKGNMGMIFTFKIREGDHAGFEITEYKRLPSSRDKEPMSEAEKNKAMSYIKMRLDSLGIPESRMNSVEKADLVGIECYVRTQVKDDFVNVKSVTLTSSATSSSPGIVTANPFG